MYRLIIVEDEDKIRSGLTKLIDWNDMGFEAVADFPDGSQALKYIERDPPDVVLTDIRMEQVSGIELAEQIRSHRKDTHIVLLSGYKDFEYARSAIACHVDNYLLKPVKLNELYQVFRELRKKLDEEQAAAERRIPGESDTELKEYLQEQFAFDLFIGALRTFGQIESQRRAAGLPALKPWFRVAVIYTEKSDQWDYGEENINTAETNVLRKIRPDTLDFYPAWMSEDQLAVCMMADDQKTLETASEGAVRELKEACGSLIHIGVSVGLSGACSELLEAPKAYLQARKNRNSRPGEEKRQVTAATQDSDTAIANIIDCIFRGDRQATKNIAERMIDGWLSAGMDEDPIRNLLVRIASKVEARIRQAIPNGDFKEFDYSLLYMSPHVLQLRQVVVDYFADMADFFAQNQVQTEKGIILRAKDYIRQHYSEKITLSLVAQSVFLSPTHFSRVFKKQTGETFIDYLTDIRIEKAKEMMTYKQKTVYEIAEEVGYSSPKYFSRIFKNYVGLTPSEYQEKLP